MMEVLIHTRKIGITVMVHVENADMIDVFVSAFPMSSFSRIEISNEIHSITNRSIERGHNDFYFHSVARPQIA